MKPKNTFIPSIVSMCLFGAGVASGQTWTSTSTGGSAWSEGTNWNTAAPAGDVATGVAFFSPGTIVPAAAAITASQDIGTPFVLNSLTVNGTGPATGVAPNLTISGGTIQFDGVSPSLLINPAYGGSGYTVNLSAPLNFNNATSINFGGGGGFITMSGAWNGSSPVTFSGSLGNRPLSLANATGTTFTGDLILAGNPNTVLQLNNVSGVLGANAATTQAVVVNNGAGVNINYGNAAQTNNQNFVLDGNGNAATANAAMNVTRINFGNSTIGGLAVAGDSTVRVVPEVTGEARTVNFTRALVGTGKLTKTGPGNIAINGSPYLPVPANPANTLLSYTWAGVTYAPFTGDIEVKEGVLLTGANHKVLGENSGGTQSVTVSQGAAVGITSGENSWEQPQNFILNGGGTGYLANTGGLAALDTTGAAYGNYTVRTLVMAGDATVSVRRNGTANGFGRGLVVSTGVAGKGTLTVGSPFGAATGPLFLNADSSAVTVGTFGPFSGQVVINNGILNIGNVNALGSSAAGRVILNGPGALSSSLAGGLNQAFFDSVTNLSSTSGAICLGSGSANDLDFTSAPNARLGAIGAFTYSGTLTPAGDVYRLGGGGGTLTVSSLLSGERSVIIYGSVVLSNPSNSFTGGILIAGNNTGVGQIASLGFTGGIGNLNGNAVSFGGAGGNLVLTGGATGSSDTLGALAFTSGHSNITSTKGASGTTSLAFSSLSGRTAGATGNFIISGGTNGSDNLITLTGAAAGFIDQGTFFGGGNYAWNDTTGAGFVRGVNWGVDAGSSTVAGGATIAGTDLAQTTAAITAQESASFKGLNIRNTANAGLAFTIKAAATLTTNGILVTGGSGGNSVVTLSGGTAVQAASGAEIVVRSDGGNDRLTINTPIIANGASSLTKTGAGSLTLGAVNTYSGATTVVAGTLTVASTGRLEDTSPVTVNGGTYNSNSSDTVGVVTLKNGAIGGTGVISGASYVVENGSVTARFSGTGGLLKSTNGMVVLSAVNTYEGGTTISGGTLSVSAAGRLDDFGAVTINNGATYEAGGADNVGDVVLIDGSIRGAGPLGSSYFDVRNGLIQAPLAGVGTINKSTSGTVTLAGRSTFVGDVLVEGGTLVLADDAMMNFQINGTSNDRVSGPGTVMFNGDFTIDVTNADPAEGNSWVLVNPTLVESYGSTFAIVGFTAAPDGTTWTRTEAGSKWTFSEGNGELRVEPAGGFATWIEDSAFGLAAASQDPGDDPDSDGMNNLIEYVLNGNPALPDPSILPDLDASGANFVFTFERRNESKDDVVQVFQYNADLGETWNEIAIPVATSGSVTVTPLDSVRDKVEVSIPKDSNTGLFGRVKVSQP